KPQAHVCSVTEAKVGFDIDKPPTAEQQSSADPPASLTSMIAGRGGRTSLPQHPDRPRLISRAPRGLHLLRTFPPHPLTRDDHPPRPVDRGERSVAECPAGAMQGLKDFADLFRGSSLNPRGRAGGTGV